MLYFTTTPGSSVHRFNSWPDRHEVSCHEVILDFSFNLDQTGESERHVIALPAFLRADDFILPPVLSRFQVVLCLPDLFTNLNLASPPLSGVVC